MLSLSPPKVNEYGDYPSVAIHPTKNFVVCGYESTVLRGKYHRAGTIEHNSISWWNEQYNDIGVYPKVAFFDKDGKIYVIHVYSYSFWSRGCYYQINKLDEEKKCIKFGKLQRFCSGMRPTLATRGDGTVVVVTENPSLFSFTLRCHIGKINDDVSEIVWSNSLEVLDRYSGTTPSVAINNTHIIVLYQVVGSSQLKYCCGSLTDKIKWKTLDQDFATGNRPTVALNNNQVVIISFTSMRSLYFGHGILNDVGFAITGEINQLGLGTNPAVAISDDNKIVEIHSSHIKWCLWVSQGN